jgi:CRP/FNR family transcriptional regulator, cyclic AMP receptor protein
MRRRFEQGEVLFRQGDPSDVAIQILSGSAEVLRHAGDDAIVLGAVQAGEFVGEMGVLEDRPRSATVRAASALEAELIERQAFLDRVSAEPELARKLLVRMSARLRDVEDMLTRIYTHGSEDAVRDRPAAPVPVAVAAAAPSSIVLAAGTKRLRAVIGGDPIAIDRLPFTVGRRPEEGQAAPLIAPDLAIPEPAPYRLSRAHFSLIAEGGEVVVRDLGSTLGTIVNNRSIGRDFPLDSVPLRPGENTIVAGGTGSPFVFAVTVS